MALLLYSKYVNQQGSLDMALLISQAWENLVVSTKSMCCGAVAQLGSGHYQAISLPVPVYVGVDIPPDIAKHVV